MVNQASLLSSLIFRISILCIVVAFWIIALSGLSAAQDTCNELIGTNNNNTCYHAFRFEWFQLFFELFMITGLCFSIVLGTIEYFKTLFLSLFLILCILTMGSADTAITQADQSGRSEYDARAAGWVMLALLNVVVVVLLAVEPEKTLRMLITGEFFGRREDVEQQQQQHQYNISIEDQYKSSPNEMQVPVPTAPPERKLPQEFPIDEENPKPSKLEDVELEQESPK